MNRTHEDLYRFVAETAVEAIVVADAAGRIVSFNRGARLLFGRGPESVGREVTILMPERFREAHRRGLRRYLRTGEKRIIDTTVEVEALHADGSEIPVELSITSFVSGKTTLFAAIIRDISERRSMERLRENVQRLVRHDIKSPLTGIGGLAKLLARSENLSAKEREWAETVRELAVTSLELIDRWRDIFRLESGEYEIRREPVDLAGVLGRVRAELAPLAEKRSVGMSFVLQGAPLDEAEASELPGDETLLEMMAANLVKNAVEASEPGDGVRIEARQEDGDWVLSVHNPAVVPEAVRDRFFELYATHGKAGGTGLGTYSARLVARAHGGEITFSTSAAQGTTVRVELPGQPPA